jgi:2-polyprenyl-6-hydroxyphenyl methylase/3-demethylubiquinone-9 3-methyltransferase
MKNQDEDELKHFSEQAQHWWDQNGPMRTLHDINPARLQFIEQHVSLSKKTVCDVGCGGGLLSEALAKVGAKVTGLDLAQPLLNAAQAHAQAQQLNIHYLCQSVESFAELHPASMDVVACMDMLEHVPDPQSIFNACADLLTPGGWLLVSTLNQTLQAKVLGVFAAEYVLNLVPTGTHHAEKFLAPHTLTSWARNKTLHPVQLMGLHYNPFNRQTSLGMPANINYLMAFKKCEHSHDR